MRARICSCREEEREGGKERMGERKRVGEGTEKEKGEREGEKGYFITTLSSFSRNSSFFSPEFLPFEAIF